MSVSVIRSPSTTPNITNSDDVRMFRFGVGNNDGYIKNRLSEFAIDASAKTIGTGELVCQGWQVLMNSVLDLSQYIQNFGSTAVYYSVYIEITISSTTATATINCTYSTSSYPTIAGNGDIGGNTTGTLRIMIYHFKTTNGAINTTAKMINAIPYAKDQISSLNLSINGLDQRLDDANQNISLNTQRIEAIDTRLDNLGFRQGSFYILGGTASLKRQGNYTLLTFAGLHISSTATKTGTIPVNFRPNAEMIIAIGGFCYSSNNTKVGRWSGFLYIEENGSIELKNVASMAYVDYGGGSGQLYTGTFDNYNVSITTGFESPAIS